MSIKDESIAIDAIDHHGARSVSELSARPCIAVDPEALARVEPRGDVMELIVVYTSG